MDIAAGDELCGARSSWALPLTVGEELGGVIVLSSLIHLFLSIDLLKKILLSFFFI
jgi:hypothetical protein